MSVSRRRFLARTLGAPLHWASDFPGHQEREPGASSPTRWPRGRCSPGPHPVGGYKVLEIFMYGGVSPWETFYVRGGIADPFFGMDAATADLDWSATCTGIPSSLDTHAGLRQ